MPREGSWEPQSGSQLRSPVKIARCCEIISQPSWVSAKSHRHHFSPAKWLLKHPEACYRHWEIFSIRFLLSKSQNTPCINFVDHFLNQGAPAKHKSAETPIGHESNGAVAGERTSNQMVPLPLPLLGTNHQVGGGRPHGCHQP
uniref:Uncharacterized protein n=1 Tax=Vitis vinifera TaxID=29760 RepID=A5AK06_VITVI|nr:hypothetical protein VITISV_039194 [Vitis vinifera]